MHLINQFISNCHAAENADEILAGMDKLITAYGLEYYAISRRDRKDGEASVQNLARRWPQGWVDFYYLRKYPLVDPVQRMLSVAHRPFRWRDALAFHKPATHRKRIVRLFQDAARHGLHDGYVFPIHGRGGLLGSVMIAGRNHELTPQQIILLEAAMKQVFWGLMAFSCGDDPLLQVADVPDVPMTRREMDVIGLLAQGMTSPEIGKELTISNHTVDWYINGIQRKFKAKNRQHVIAMAFRFGLIS